MNAHVQKLSRLIVWVGLLGGLFGCSTAAVEPAAESAPPTVTAPEGVLRAREAVLAFLRDGANECVPPKQAGWTMEPEAAPPAGYEVYRFESGGCMMTVTTALDPGEDVIYHVALGDGPTGFCWQSIVDANGRILLTGNDAQTDPTFGNPAKNYCEANGYTFEVVTRPGGQLCGVCVFDDARSCNAWAYFHGACTPDNAPTATP